MFVLRLILWKRAKENDNQDDRSSISEDISKVIHRKKSKLRIKNKSRDDKMLKNVKYLQNLFEYVSIIELKQKFK